MHAAQMVQDYATYISGVKIQTERFDLEEEIGHLQLAQTEMVAQFKANEEKVTNLEESLRAARADTHEALAELDLEKGKVMAYSTQLIEEQQKIQN